MPNELRSTRTYVLCFQDDSSDSDSDYDIRKAVTAQTKSDKSKKSKSNKDGFEIVPATEPGSLY